MGSPEYRPQISSPSDKKTILFLLDGHKVMESPFLISRYSRTMESVDRSYEEWADSLG